MRGTRYEVRGRAEDQSHIDIHINNQRRRRRRRRMQKRRPMKMEGSADEAQGGSVGVVCMVCETRGASLCGVVWCGVVWCGVVCHVHCSAVRSAWVLGGCKPPRRPDGRYDHDSSLRPLPTYLLRQLRHVNKRVAIHGNGWSRAARARREGGKEAKLQ